MPVQALSLQAFAFGKLPTHGDFVARGLPAAEREAWDAWSSAGLQAARETLGEAFEARHDAARPLRFAFGPGPFGTGWRAGVVAASIDTAGRRFVIVLGARAAGALPPDGVGGAVAETAEEAVYRAFETAADIDAAVLSAQDDFQTMESIAESESEGRFWLPDSSLDIVACQPPADLITRVMTL
ncbi:type VI secretion system-associated protein TagF [Caulobacter sp. CCUG 60055]|uniref:type VI secretion system-associated protein TagF n=2 Tax=Pseudomonadota TaxID=1224 RepID=UPI001FA709BC|nr:type VI secretion system-associated protein TagF [Caulobacter sp. CCUG 60055]MBQ1542663.1 type VI secretion system-associated protein TagF [Caulobacteraceae bacterium]MCI3179466.1 type VI secretion system-associated protein TagF [Caulobacter sp. CCUG 60055]